MTPPSRAPRFVGCIRLTTRGPWVEAARAATFGDCWQQLLDRSPGNCDLVVVPVDRNPNSKAG